MPILQQQVHDNQILVSDFDRSWFYFGFEYLGILVQKLGEFWFAEAANIFRLEFDVLQYNFQSLEWPADSGTLIGGYFLQEIG